MTDETPYREGHEEETEKVPEGPVPVTGFLVLLYPDGRVDAVVDLPGVTKQREASLRDIRDLSHSLHLDVVNTIQAKSSARVMSESMQKAMTQAANAKIAAQISRGIKG